jgi:hypothetical protein
MTALGRDVTVQLRQDEAFVFFLNVSLLDTDKPEKVSESVRERTYRQ